MIHQYIKGKNGQLIGCVVAINREKVGWSKCRTTYGIQMVNGIKYPVGPDKFDKKKALEIAIGRATRNPVYDLNHVPRSIVNHVNDMFKRSERYFKIQQKFWIFSI